MIICDLLPVCTAGQLSRREHAKKAGTRKICSMMSQNNEKPAILFGGIGYSEFLMISLPQKSNGFSSIFIINLIG